MGRKLMPCNLTEGEQVEAWEEFDSWLTPEEEAEVMEQMGNYLFYQPKNRGKVRECFCTRPGCGGFHVQKKEEPGFWMLKHGRYGRCPRCRQTVKILALGKMRSFQTINDVKWSRVTICRTGAEGALLLMSAYVHRQFSWDDLRGIPDVSWKTWTYLAPGKRMQWENRLMPIGERICGGWEWDYQWQWRKTVKEPFQPTFYGEGGDSFFVGTDAIDRSGLRYCQVEDWIWQEAGASVAAASDPIRHVVTYLSTYSRYPTMEMAMKLGLHHAVTDLVKEGKKNHSAINWEGRTMQDFLRLSKQDARVFFQNGGDLEILAAYHTARKAKAIAGMGEFLAFLRAANAMGHAEALARCTRKAGCTLRQASNYVRKQEGTTDRLLITWEDYLNMAKQLHFDMSRLDVTMPKDLQDRHDAAAETLSYHRKVEEQKKHREFNRRLRKMYEFSYGDLCITVPGSTEEIITEGRVLKHCVGGYAARHFTDQVTILFLRHRRKPDTPFCTIEIVPRKTMKDKVIIRQIHGYQNEQYLNRGRISRKLTQDQIHRCRPEYKHKWFLDVWRAWVQAGSKRDRNGNPILTEMKEKTA